MAQTTTNDACQHHWLIDRPNGPTSKGVCRLCSEERDFPNYIEGNPHVRTSAAWRTRRANGQMV